MHEFVEVTTSSKQVEAITDLIGPILITFPRPLAFAACLTLAIMLLKPDVTKEQLQDSLSGASKWLCAYLEPEQLMKIHEAKRIMN